MPAIYSYSYISYPIYLSIHISIDLNISIYLNICIFRRRDLNDIIAHFSKEQKHKKKTYNVKPVVHGKGEKDSKVWHIEAKIK